MANLVEGMKWKEVFGEAWPKIIEFCHEIGGFLIIHETQQIFLDGNARTLSGLENSVGYDEMLDFLNKLPQQYDNGTQLVSQIVLYSDDYTAGILRRAENIGEWERRSILPVCENSRLVLEVTQNTAPSMLALVEFTAGVGREPTKFQTFDALAAIIKNSPEGTLVSLHSANRFWLYIPNFDKNSGEFLSELQGVVSEVSGGRVSFSAGVGACEASLDERMNTAEFSLYEANLEGAGSIVEYSVEQYESSKDEYEKMSRFLRLINENLFVYHFQPIVSASNGEIVAYEMLMRSDSSIGMYPLEILDCAEKAQRLYDIEMATMKNALSIIGAHQDLLMNRKVFVNSITAHMLTDEDWRKLEDEYGELMEKMVIEFTEQTEVDDAKLAEIHERLGRRNIKLAVDDYGTGYSNTSNLIRYNPDYVKIDCALIEGIHTKPKIRKLVLGIIEFIHENGYLALAEGVETIEELQTMIQLGADLIQGYYTSKPKPVMLLQISDIVCRDIENINLANSGNISRSYHPKEGETVDLCMIRSDNYSSVFIETENVTLNGRADMLLDTLFVVKDGIKTKIVLDNVRVKSDKEPPLIMLGEGCDVEIVSVGKNYLDGKGIYVPKSSSLKLEGDGCLDIISNKANCYAIGTDVNESHGNIIIAMKGKLSIEANGDNVTAIGGGKNENSNVIRLISGDISLVFSGRSCMGIGVTDGNGIVDIENCKLTIAGNSPNSVGVGSFKNMIDISIKNVLIDVRLNGISTTCIGSFEEGSGKVLINNSNINMNASARTVNCIGTRNGNMGCLVFTSCINIYCECGSVSGIGDIYGDGDVRIEETEMNFTMLTGEGLGYGSRRGLVTTAHCVENIIIN